MDSAINCNKKMEHKIKSIRPFIGAKNFEISRNFYQDLGFQETILSNNMSVFKIEGFISPDRESFQAP